MGAFAVTSTVAGWSPSAVAPLKARGSQRGVSRRTGARTLPRSARADAAIIDGKAIALVVREEVRVRVAAMKEKHGKTLPSFCNTLRRVRTRRTPPCATTLAAGLAVVLVGARKDSETYVRSKKKACAEAGITSFGKDLPVDATEDEVLAVVAAYNADPDCHGILVQLPMPAHINEERVLGAIDYEKDVDGFHPLNTGRLSQRGREPLFVPCTPRGCIELLERSGIAIAGKEAVVVGRSNVVGTPAALLLQRRDATVTICHSRTPNPEEIIRRADIVIAACGKAEMIKGEWLKPGCAVIDVGINAKDDPTKKRGYRLVGDVDFESCSKVAGFITPVPGGVGPMTIAILLQNCLEGALRTYGIDPKDE